MKKIIYTRPSDGGLSIVTPALGGRLIVMTADRVSRDSAVLLEMAADGEIVWAETEDEWFARIQAKDVPADAIDVQIVEEEALPQDRTFRDAWVHKAGVVSVDMKKARAV